MKEIKIELLHPKQSEVDTPANAERYFTVFLSAKSPDEGSPRDSKASSVAPANQTVLGPTRFCVVVLEKDAIAKEVSRQLLEMMKKRMNLMSGSQTYKGQIQQALTLQGPVDKWGARREPTWMDMIIFTTGFGWVSVEFICFFLCISHHVSSSA
jgi:hypothetical protein